MPPSPRTPHFGHSRTPSPPHSYSTTMSRRTPTRKAIPSPLALSLMAPTTAPQSPPSPSPRRRCARQMRLRNPGFSGLYTLSEEEEDQHDMMTPTAAANASRSSWPLGRTCPPSSLGTSRASAMPSSTTDSHDLYTPGSENEDPFSLEDWDMDGDTPTLATFRNTCGNSSNKAPTRPSRRPPPLNLEPYRAPLRLGGPLKPPRVSSASSTALPHTTPTVPTAIYGPTLLPASQLVPHAEWSRIVENAGTPPESRSPVTPSTPTSSDHVGINLVSALRELLTSCCEYEGFDDVFADARETGSPSRTAFATPPPKANPMTPEREYFIRCPNAPARKPRPYERRRRASSLPSDHSFLQAMSAECRENILDADEDVFSFDYTCANQYSTSGRSPSPVPSLCGSSSSSSISSASSAGSLASIASGKSYQSLASISGSATCTEAAKPLMTPSSVSQASSRRVSSRRPLPVRCSLPSSWTGYTP